MRCLLCFFFFQAEDGIRDLTVTGVQTCALPISEFPYQQLEPGRLAADEALAEAPLVLRIVEQEGRHFAARSAGPVRRPRSAAAPFLVTWFKSHTYLLHVLHVP